ncbi:MAG TPA: GvpL/GvpF family gas vesicle protein [Flexivirga sp.]|uniref:GvpL/GvpF family gas vesicle protein n=1 Tax=Flexivirga sp. TaxID=1962927 RepID=UPI002D06B583|nr:GvpL/GvpF family gas vesicle protein [Flexivirga sp.]HWC21739.1 GvpL/GvpF family gas vesicle protein [Flexivirga sp.]
MVDLARYMYAVSRPFEDGALAAPVTGIAEGRIDTVRHRNLVAIVSDVDLSEFGEAALRANLEQLAWLETVARAHHRVVQAVSSASPTAPLRLGTICLDDDGVRRRLAEWHDRLERVLDRVQGRREWSVKVLAPAHRETVAATATTPTGGADYLRRKKAQAEAKLTAGQGAARAAARLHEVLGAAAVAARTFPAQDPALSGRRGTMLLNAAYLVPADGIGAFQACVDAARAEVPDLVIDSQGPWPPYAFAMLDSDD